MKLAGLSLLCLFGVAVSFATDESRQLRVFPSREQVSQLWRRIVPAKGVFVAKLKSEKSAIYVFFAGSNGPRYTSELRKVGVTFSSLDDPVLFSFMRPKEVILMPPSANYPTDNSKTLLPFTVAEETALGLR